MNTKERQIALVKILQKNPNSLQAKKELYDSIYRFIYGLVLKLTRDYTIVDDLVNEAFISVLLNAVPKYKENTGCNFLSYASFWIMHSAKCYLLDNLTPFRLPRDVASVYYRKISGSDEDFSKNKKYIKDALGYKFVSTEYKVFDDLKINDVLADGDGFLKQLSNEDEVNTLINNADLSEKELEILLDTSGYTNDLTALEKSERYGCSKQRIQQLRKRAIYKIRKSIEERNKVDRRKVLMETKNDV